MARYEFAPRHVIEARYLGDYKVWLEFNDGRKGVVDLADELHGEGLECLRDRERFSQFYLDYGLASIAWLDGQDFTPEFLYDKLKAMHYRDVVLGNPPPPSRQPRRAAAPVLPPGTRAGLRRRSRRRPGSRTLRRKALGKGVGSRPSPPKLERRGRLV